MLADKPMWWFDQLRHHRHHSCLLSSFAEDYGSNAAMTRQTMCVLLCHSHKKLKCGGLSHRQGGFKLWEFSEKYWFGDFYADLCEKALDNVRHENREKVNTLPGFFSKCWADTVGLFAALLSSPFPLLLPWFLINYEHFSGHRSSAAARRLFPEWMVALCLCVFVSPLDCLHCQCIALSTVSCLGIFSVCITVT